MPGPESPRAEGDSVVLSAGLSGGKRQGGVSREDEFRGESIKRPGAHP